MATLTFFVTLALQVAAIFFALRSASPSRRRLARSAVVVSLAVVFGLLRAPVPAVAALMAAVAIGLAPSSGTEGRLEPVPWPKPVAVGAFLLLVFVSLGTMARQVVTYGATAKDRPRLGNQESVVESLLTMSWPVLGLFALLALVFAASSRRPEPAAEERD